MQRDNWTYFWGYRCSLSSITHLPVRCSPPWIWCRLPPLTSTAVFVCEAYGVWTQRGDQHFLPKAAIDKGILMIAVTHPLLICCRIFSLLCSIFRYSMWRKTAGKHVVRKALSFHPAANTCGFNASPPSWQVLDTAKHKTNSVKFTFSSKNFQQYFSGCFFFLCYHREWLKNIIEGKGWSLWKRCICSAVMYSDS